MATRAAAPKKVPRWRLGAAIADLSASEAGALALHAERRVRERAEALLRDRVVALLAHAVGAFLDLGERQVDLLDGGLRLRAQREVALPLDGEGVALTGLLVELHVA